MPYRIWAEVSGGVTGHRAAWAKSNGEVLEFATREEAEGRAKKMREGMNHSRSLASFSYTVKEV